MRADIAIRSPARTAPPTQRELVGPLGCLLGWIRRLAASPRPPSAERRSQ